MLNRKNLLHLATASVVGSSFFVSAVASAAPLACVQRAIDWNNSAANHFTEFSTVAMHDSGSAAYLQGTLRNSFCSRAPYYTGSVACLVATVPTSGPRAGWLQAFLNKPVVFTGANPQYFNAANPLLFTIDVIPADTLAQVHMRQPSATYDMDGRCQGNLLLGDDQWGNHWATSFQLQTGSPPN